MDSIYKNAISTAAITMVPSSYALPQPGSTVDKSQQTKTTTKPLTDILIEQLSSDDISYVDSYSPQSSSSSPSLSTSITTSESSSSVTIEASGSVKRITNVDDIANDNNDNNDNNIENLNREKQRMRNNELFRCLFIKIVPSTIMHIVLYFRVLFVLIYIFSLYYSAYMIIFLIL